LTSTKPASATSTVFNPLSIKVTCGDLKTPDMDKILFSFDQKTSAYSIEFGSIQGCGTDPVEFMKKFKYMFIPGLIIFGLLIAFFGNKMFKYTLMFCGFAAG
jgi:hypothetical protein